MMSPEQFEQVAQKLDTIIRLVAGNLLKDAESKARPSRQERKRGFAGDVSTAEWVQTQSRLLRNELMTNWSQVKTKKGIAREKSPPSS